MNQIAKFFRFDERETNFKTEIIAGLTTFMTMAYVLAVQPSAMVGFGEMPSMIDVNGVLISKEAIMIMVAITTGLFTFVMAIYANLPFAISTGMGSNFLLGTLVQSGAYSFAAIMTITFLGGLLFTIFTILGVREAVSKIMPKNIKIAMGTAIGFFVAYLGFKNTGIGVYVNGIGRGDFTQPTVYLAILGLLIIAILSALKVKGAILYGILGITFLGIPFGVTKIPAEIFSVPSFSDVKNVVFQFNISELFNAEAFILIFTIFTSDFFGTMGTILGLTGKAGMLDENGNFEGMEKPFLVDAVGTMMGGMLGCTNISTYVESSAGIEAGGRTGFTAIVTGILFILTIFIAPLAVVIPDIATGPALIYVGFLMISGIKNVDLTDLTDAFGPFVMIMFTIFCGSIAAGIAAGLLGFVIIKTFTGKAKEVHPFMYFTSIILVLYFIYG